jgi:hypothetical protein
MEIEEIGRETFIDFGKTLIKGQWADIFPAQQFDYDDLEIMKKRYNEIIEKPERFYPSQSKMDRCLKTISMSEYENGKY